MEEYYDLFLKCYPDIVASETHVKETLADPSNLTLERRDQGKLIAALIMRNNTILFLGVDAEYRGRGIGSELLAEAEELLFGLGRDEIKLFGVSDQILPGAPLYPGTMEFFGKRGYYQKEDEMDFQDLSLELNAGKDQDDWQLGMEKDGIEYRWGTPEDREAAVNCAGEAQQRYEEVYWKEDLYLPDRKLKVLIATPADEAGKSGYDPAHGVCGTLMVDMRGYADLIGGMGFASVKPAWAGQGIAQNMVKMALAELAREGFRKAYARCVSTQAVYLYEACGFKKGHRYFRGRKALNEDVIARQRAMIKEVYIQYRELEGRMDQIEQRIYDQFCQQGHQMSEIKKLQIYVKPQDFTAYYMINDSIAGKVGIF